MGILAGTSNASDGTGWSLNGFGTPIGEGPAAPLDVAMARWFLQGREAHVLSPEDSLDRFDGVLVMGDGSASRTEKAPRGLNPQAAAFDQSAAAALVAGDPAALAELDLGLGSDVGASGAAAWSRLGRAVHEVTSASLDAECDPYGVLYLVARWTVRWADPA